ncbi:MAG TPA: SAM-dependent methyltransferase [Pseudonocardia sp.]|uniref:SAM-dependent methyltransferase n=1 Tax=Pseudonocardia sp. TaxID=60912 RepID=UPI002B4ACE73|nr:SAM-dependent methyltransferase [Pseudonocardia sp.]HLU58343.1 SAM-dependent methyltransferase [Pseudonocardia sp.]
MTDLSQLPAVDPDVPNAARMYDYYLGGSHNFAADRAAAERIKAVMPFIVDAARSNRFFLHRAVRFCVQEGIDQFLDLGSGIPTAGNVHEAALAINPRARVAYVDNEPVTVASAAALLVDEPRATITHADIRDPCSVFSAPGVRDLLDLSRPIALLTVAVLHHIPDEDDPVGLVREYRARLAPGSFHVLTHATTDHDALEAKAAAEVYRGIANPITTRTRQQVAALFGDAELVEPGLVDATQWRPEDTVGGQHRGFWAGVARIA